MRWASNEIEIDSGVTSDIRLFPPDPVLRQISHRTITMLQPESSMRYGTDPTADDLFKAACGEEH